MAKEAQPAAQPEETPRAQKKKMVARTAKSDAGTKTRLQLKNAALEAVQWMAEKLADPDASDELKYKCATAILERVYGKAGLPIESEKDKDGAVALVLSEEVQKYAK